MPSNQPRKGRQPYTYDHYEAEIRKLFPEVQLLKAFVEANPEDLETAKELEKKKICSKCKKEKELSEFPKNKSSGDGYGHHCKQCQKERYYENRDKILKQKKEYRLKNIEKIKLKDKEYYENNRKEKIEYAKNYYMKYKEKISEYKKENRDRFNAYNREYYENHYQNEIYRESFRRSYKKYYETHGREKAKQYRVMNSDHRREYQKKYYQKNSEQLIEYAKMYRKTPEGRECSKRNTYKRRNWGFTPINKQFEKSHFHHLHLNKMPDLGVYIPDELHLSIKHNSKTWRGMDEINKAALLWLCEQAVI